MPLVTTALVTVDEVKSHLQIPPTTTSKDAVIEQLANGVSVALRNWSRRPLVHETLVERHTGSDASVNTSSPWSAGSFGRARGGARTINLLNYPVVSITSVVDEGTVVQTLTEGTDFVVDKKHGVLEHYSCFPVPFKGDLLGWWVVTLVAGYFADTDSVDADVKLAASLWIANVLAKKAGGLSSITTGSLTASFAPGAMPDEVRALMGRYRGNHVS